VGEKLQIGEDVTVVVLEVDLASGKVRLGIEAPRSVQVWRGELLPLLRPREDGEASQA
jgi:carbon storage regulator CsrA